MHTPQSNLVREALTRESAAGRYLYIKPRQLPPECLEGVDALASRRAEREVASLALEPARHEKAA